MLRSEHQAERTTIQIALRCVNNVVDLTNYLELAVRPGSERLHRIERVRILTTPMNSGDLGLRVMMDFIRNNFEAINEVQQGSTSTMLSAISVRVVSQEMFEEFDELLTVLQGSGLITESHRGNLKGTFNGIFLWQERYVEEIRIALQGF